MRICTCPVCSFISACAIDAINANDLASALALVSLISVEDDDHASDPDRDYYADRWVPEDFTDHPVVN